MAPQTSEAFAVAGRTSGFVEIHLTCCVPVQKIWSMIRGFQIKRRGMALGATEGRIHLAMANQAVFHMWKMILGDGTCLGCKTSMAGLAWVVSDQVATQFQDVNFVG